MPVLHCLLMRDGRARALRKRPEDREDVIQEALLRAWKNRAVFDPQRGSLLHWLRRIARNLAIDLQRRPSFRTQGLPPGAETALPGKDEAADVRLAAEELQEELDEALRTVSSPTARKAIELRLTGAPYADISQQLHLPLGTVASVVYRFRRQLKQTRQAA